MAQEQTTNSQVFWRFDSPSNLDNKLKDKIQLSVNGNTISVPSSNHTRKKSYTFDGIFSSNTSQDDVFTFAVRQACDDVLKGFDICFFTYGQTRSRKTCCMFGDEDVKNDCGIIQMSIKHIFNTLQLSNSVKNYTIKISFLKILDGNVIDLCDNKNELDWEYDESTLTESICNLTHKKVKDSQTALNLIKQCLNGNNNNSNNNSALQSRSHLILSIIVHSETKDGKIIDGVGNFVHLAGSEHVVSNNSNEKELETKESLLNLQEVIESLAQGTNIHEIEHRDTSLLVKILKPLLPGNNCKTRWIFHSITQLHRLNKDATLDALEFATICRKIKNIHTIKPNITIANNIDHRPQQQQQQQRQQQRQRKPSISRRDTFRHTRRLSGQLSRKRNSLGTEFAAVTNKLACHLNEVEKLKQEKKEHLYLIKKLTNENKNKENHIKELLTFQSKLMQTNKKDTNENKNKNENDIVNVLQIQLTSATKRIKSLEQELQLKVLHHEQLIKENSVLKNKIDSITTKLCKDDEWQSKYTLLENEYLQLRHKLIASEERISNPAPVDIDDDDDSDDDDDDAPEQDQMEMKNKDKENEKENGQLSDNSDTSTSYNNPNNNDDRWRNNQVDRPSIVPMVDAAINDYDRDESKTNVHVNVNGNVNANVNDNVIENENKQDNGDEKESVLGPEDYVRILVPRLAEVLCISPIEKHLAKAETFIQLLTADNAKLTANYVECVHHIDNEFDTIVKVLKQRQLTLKRDLALQFNDIANVLDDSVILLKNFKQRCENCIQQCKYKIKQMPYRQEQKQRELEIKILCNNCIKSIPKKIYQPPIEFKISYSDKNKLLSTANRYGFIFGKTRFNRYFKYALSFDTNETN